MGRLTCVNDRLAHVSHSGSLDNVPNGESLDGLVLTNASRAVGAADKVNVATALLVTAVTSSLLSLCKRKQNAMF